MKHPIANIQVEGQGWNPYSIVEEGQAAFAKRIEVEGHYQKLSDDLPTTAEQRAEIAKVVFDKATAYVEANPSSTIQAAKAVKVEAKKEETKK